MGVSPSRRSTYNMADECDGMLLHLEGRLNGGWLVGRAKSAPGKPYGRRPCPNHPRRRLKEARDLLGAEDEGDLARLAHEHQAASELDVVEGDGEKEPHRRHRAVDLRRPHPGLRLVQLEAAKIIRCRGIRRAAEEGCERPDVTDIVVLRLLDNWRTVMSSIMGRRNGLMRGLISVSLHRGAPVLR